MLLPLPPFSKITIRTAQSATKLITFSNSQSKSQRFLSHCPLILQYFMISKHALDSAQRRSISLALRFVLLLPVLAAQQRMSEKERYRRDITGSLSAATISKTLKLMGLQEKLLSAAPKSSSKTGIIKYDVEGSSKYFKIPSWFEMSLVTSKTVGKQLIFLLSTSADFLLCPT